MGSVTGYIHPGYAESLAEFGEPRQLPRSGGWILERQIPGFDCRDAMGCYPLFACRDWSQLHLDLAELETELVSLALVADPFGSYDQAYLQCCFQDRVIRFKEHFVIELGPDPAAFVSSHHRRYARKALAAVKVEPCAEPGRLLDRWVELYDILIKRHNITGISAFSQPAFARQLNLPGLVAFQALHEETIVGMLLWYVQETTGYYHLAAYTPLGYQLRASFALFWKAIEYFTAAGLKWLNLGAGAGVRTDGRDGLTHFKQGWATGTRPAYFCGRIFDRARYAEITRAKGISLANYFPAYRQGEFG